jgi:alkanesulfonate monooxygenase SsuD/methylene tetrahydromethanopterin reductase-like flavin-dependent oxidoreductase (luciferase family)
MKEEFDTLGVDFSSRGARYDEMLEILALLWSTGQAEYHGRHFDFDALSMQPVPSRPVDVYVGGVSGPALRRAARTGQGWIGPGTATNEVKATIGRIDALRAEYGRASEPYEYIVPLTATPSVDAFARARDDGATATVSYPFSYALGPRSTLDSKRAYMEDFAERYIAPLS